MSGPKAADVALKLDRAIKAVESQMKEAAKNAAKYEELGSARKAAMDGAAAKALAEAGAALDSETAALAPEAAEQARRLAGEIREKAEQGQRLMAEAQRMGNEAQALHDEANRMIADAGRGAEAVLRAMGGRRHYLQAEDNKAKGVRKLADEALNKERQAGNKIKAALDKKRAAEKALGEADYFAKERAKIRQEAEGTARQKREAERIAEENKREAAALNHEAGNIANRIAGMNHEKFAPGEFAKVRAAADNLAQAFDRGDYDAVKRAGDACLRDLGALAGKVAEAQAAWENARRAAKAALDAAGQELGAGDEERINRWAGDKAGLAGIKQPLADAQRAFDEERFAEAEAAAGAAVEKVRMLDEQAQVNCAKAGQRNDIADAIMNALYEQGYDEPAFYHANADTDGNEDELSDVVIYAKAPGEKGDMRMQIDLDGHIALEVEGIGEGEEHICHQMIEDFQQRLGGEVDFAMVDWGRAAGAAGAGKVQVPEREREQQKQRERQGE